MHNSDFDTFYLVSINKVCERAFLKLSRRVFLSNILEDSECEYDGKHNRHAGHAFALNSQRWDSAVSFVKRHI